MSERDEEPDIQPAAYNGLGAAVLPGAGVVKNKLTYSRYDQVTLGKLHLLLQLGNL